MDGVAREQLQILESVELELADVRLRLERLYNLVETTDMDINNFKPRIRDHRERQERLEATAERVRALLSQRRVVLDDVKTITSYAEDMGKFLNESELTELRAFVKEIEVRPGSAGVRYSIPIPRTAKYLEGAPRRWPFTGRYCLPSSMAGWRCLQVRRRC